jgi:hypothetical protein
VAGSDGSASPFAGKAAIMAPRTGHPGDEKTLSNLWSSTMQGAIRTRTIEGTLPADRRAVEEQAETKVVAAFDAEGTPQTAWGWAGIAAGVLAFWLILATWLAFGFGILIAITRMAGAN